MAGRQSRTSNPEEMDGWTVNLMSLLEKALRYRRVHGTRKLIVDSIARLRARTNGHAPYGALSLPAVETGWVNARELVRAHHSATFPLRLFTVPNGGSPRVSLVTDSINRGSLYGGVGTAMILASVIAESRGARLRIVTRTERAAAAGLEGVLKAYGLELSREIEFAHAPCYDSGYDLDTFDGELFITTSWWTTASTLASVSADSVLYLLQEDERMFYPYGDEHLRCSKVLQDPSVRCVINTRLLYDHLVGSGLSHLTSSAMWFEPAFPPSLFHPRPRDDSRKRTIMLYARPNNSRNLFLFGLDLIETAITRGILDLEAWDIVLVGKEIPKIRFDDGGYSPKRLEYLPWADYAELVGRVDLGICLMYTPHPSYPPLDLAASGAVVVTNRCGLKQNLDAYSTNIVCGDLEMSSMLTALAEGIRLASSPEEREANYRASALGRDWQAAFAEVVRRYGRDG